MSRMTSLHENLLDPAEIRFFEEIQTLLNARAVRLSHRIDNICGVDAAYSSKGNKVAAAAVLLKGRYQREVATYQGEFSLPYVSGLFYLHEGPFAIAAVRRLSIEPQLVCFDAQGVAHPRSKGLATICGMILGIPSVGITKNILVGKPYSYKYRLDKLRFKDQDIGIVTRGTKERFWSPGYSVNLEDLENIVSIHGETILEALRSAHGESKKLMASLNKRK
jgi:deoxyribonuclease V